MTLLLLLRGCSRATLMVLRMVCIFLLSLLVGNSFNFIFSFLNFAKNRKYLVYRLAGMCFGT